MKFKFTVNDLCAITTVESAIDDFSIYSGLASECCSRPGDANNDERRNIIDVVYIADWLYDGGPQSSCTEEMDADGDGSVLMADITYIVNWLFIGGAVPVCP